MQQEKLSLANFSERLKFALEKRGLKPTPTAKKLGISTGYLSDLLKGNKGHPSLETLRKLSGELRCRVQWLERGEGDFKNASLETSSTTPNQLESPGWGKDPRMEETLRLARELNAALAPAVKKEISRTLRDLMHPLETVACNDGDFAARMKDAAKARIDDFADWAAKFRKSHKNSNLEPPWPADPPA